MVHLGTNYPVYPNKMPQAGVQLKVDRRASSRSSPVANDIGQGSNSVVAYIVQRSSASMRRERARRRGDTDSAPWIGRVQLARHVHGRNATIDAARKLRTQIVTAVAKHWQVEERRVRLIAGAVIDVDDVAKSLTSVEASTWPKEMFDTLGATGAYNTPDPGATIARHDRRLHRRTRSPRTSSSSPSTWKTGRITIHNVWIAHDCGRALNPIARRRQMEGSAYMVRRKR